MGANLERMKKAVADGKVAGQRKKHRPKPLLSVGGPKPATVEFHSRAEKIAARDKEMDDRGRWPQGTNIKARMTAAFQWWVEVSVPTSPISDYTMQANGGALHQLLTDLYHEWLKAGKPGAS